MIQSNLIRILIISVGDILKNWCRCTAEEDKAVLSDLGYIVHDSPVHYHPLKKSVSKG